MAKIDAQIEQRIKDSAKIADVMESCGFQLHRIGNEYECLCPFHDDQHMGNFKVNPRKNIYYCFSCGSHGDPIGFLQQYEGMKYGDALRYLAAMYNIYIDDSRPLPKVKKYEPRQPLPPTRRLVWKRQLANRYAEHVRENNLVKWMLNLPWKQEDKAQLEVMLQLYRVGTSLAGNTKGWAVFPQIDLNLFIRDMKLMAYKPDGHRNKDRKYNFNWMSAILKKENQFDENKYHVEHCLFGLHLACTFDKAEVCLVESEKSAVLCSAFSDPEQRIWMATGGKDGLKPTMLLPLLQLGRSIVVFPDFDGYDDWTERVKALDTPLVTVSQMVRKLHIPSDGPKADIADIMVRLMSGVHETETDKAFRLLGIDDNPALADLIKQLDLKLY